ncbi:aldo/keto reductase, partial [Nocardiopsis tropica]|nr:aldo/keto reductase [Nocardiopsis tropica]
MRHTTIGDRSVSALCLGAMKFGSQTDDATSAALLDRFVEAGGTFVDTA